MTNHTKLIRLLGFCALLALNHIYAQEIPQSGLMSITAEEMKSHVMFLASDKMKGRNTPSPELDSCAAYIAREFSSYGLKALGPDGSFYQTFNMLRAHLGQPNRLILTRNETSNEFNIKDDFIPLRNTANRKVSGPVVFAGYGITAPEYHYDDYQGIDVQDKIVLIFSDEPQQKDTSSVFLGTRRTKYSRLESKIKNAVEHGAAGLIYVNNPGKRFRRPPNFWPGLMRGKTRISAPMSMEENVKERIVCMQIGRALLDSIFATSTKSPEQLYEIIDQTLQPQSFIISAIQITMETNLNAERFPVHNVVGYLEGSDPQTINPKKMEHVGRLVFSTAWTVANMDGRPNFTKVN